MIFRFFNKAKQSNDGFTLIEVIIALVLCSILAVMMATYLSSSLSRSVEPGKNFRDTLRLYSVMELIRLCYDNNSTMDLDSLKTQVGSVGTTGTNPFTNPTSAYPVNDDNSSYSYTVLYNGYIACDPSSSSSFTADTSGTNETLMITIGDPTQNNIQLTRLFTTK